MPWEGRDFPTLVSPREQDSESVYEEPGKEGLEKENMTDYEAIHSFTRACRRCFMNTYCVSGTEDIEGKKRDKQKAEMKPLYFCAMVEKDIKQINMWVFNYNDDM